VESEYHDDCRRVPFVSCAAFLSIQLTFMDIDLRSWRWAYSGFSFSARVISGDGNVQACDFAESFYSGPCAWYK
jgi:hypothetical protein